MATKYVDSVGGDNTTGDSWATAYATLQQGLTGAGAGGLVYIEDNHSETAGGALTLTSPGMAGSPTKVICASSVDTSLSTGASVASAVNTTLGIGGYIWIYGVDFNVGDSLFLLSSLNNYVRMEQCSIYLSRDATNRYISVGSSSSFQFVLHLIDTDIKFTNVAENFIIGSGIIIWDGGSLDSSGAAPVDLFEMGSNRSGYLIVKNVDLSHAGASSTLVSFIGTTTGFAEFQSCKLHASVTPIGTAITGNGQWVKIHRCDSANLTYEFSEHYYTGTISEDISIYLNATDGTVPLSIKMLANGNGEEMYDPLASPPITAWTDSTASTNFTIELAIDSATTLNDDDVWVELETPGSNAIAVKNTSRMAILGTPAELTTSSASWTGLGGSPKKYKITLTVTPGKAGLVTARVHLSRLASTTIYVDPYITES